MAQLDITHREHGRGGEYIAKPAGSVHRGHLEYELSDDGARIATHTLVPPQIAGNGVAAQLVDAMIADARESGFKIEPRCSYVAAKFDQNPEWSDLRA